MFSVSQNNDTKNIVSNHNTSFLWRLKYILF